MLTMRSACQRLVLAPSGFCKRADKDWEEGVWFGLGGDKHVFLK